MLLTNTTLSYREVMVAVFFHVIAIAEQELFCNSFPQIIFDFRGNPEYNYLMTNNQYYIYILFSKRNGTLYTGVTNDLIKRVWEHKNKIQEGFTKNITLINSGIMKYVMM